MISNKLQICLLAGALSVAVVSCKKSERTSEKPQTTVSQQVLDKIEKLGFSSENVIARDGGYLVEGDILLTEENLKSDASSPNLRVAQDEQYRTNNLVTGLPRTITVSVSNLSNPYSKATDLAIDRYNAQSLRITFQRVSSNGNIVIIGFNDSCAFGFTNGGRDVRDYYEIKFKDDTRKEYWFDNEELAITQIKRLYLAP